MVENIFFANFLVICEHMKTITSLFGSGKPKMKILFVSSEEAPFAKVGGLGEVMYSLPRALKRLGHDARVMMPFYGTVDREKYKTPYVKKELVVASGAEEKSERIVCNVLRFEPKLSKRDPVTTYFLENREYYELRSNAYGYKDDRLRFALLSKACLEFLATSSDWLPDVIVTTDWISGYLPNFLKTEYKENKKLSTVATVFSIHNLAAQGTERPDRFLSENEKDDGYGPLPDLFNERLKDINSMKRGIIFSDLINTVSSTYASEILTEEYGEGLDGLLREKRDKLYGILNGIDYQTNDPATDKYLPAKFSLRNFDARKLNKAALQKRFGLPQDKAVFTMGIVSRIVKQKGFALLQSVIEPFLKATGAQLIIVGTGDSELMDYFLGLQKRLPDQVVAHLQYDEDLPHLIYAGCDVSLIPSKYEPSGLTQMEAMRYGSVPVARRTGGLADTIDDGGPGSPASTGFLFNNMDPLELLIAMTRAYSGWRHRAEWKSLRKRVMQKDFSWDKSAKEYTVLFEKAIAVRRNAKKSSK